MVYDDLRIALERQQRLRGASTPEDRQEMKRFWISCQVSILLPAEAKELKDTQKKQQERNRIRMGMPEHEADFMFCFRKTPSLTAKSGRVMRDSMKNMVMRLYPANSFYAEGSQTAGEQEVWWFDFDSFGLDGKIYNFMFFVPILSGQDMLIGSFRCLDAQAVKWKPVFMNLISSLESEILLNDRNDVVKK